MVTYNPYLLNSKPDLLVTKLLEWVAWGQVPQFLPLALKSDATELPISTFQHQVRAAELVFRQKQAARAKEFKSLTLQAIAQLVVFNGGSRLNTRRPTLQPLRLNFKHI